MDASGMLVVILAPPLVLMLIILLGELALYALFFWIFHTCIHF